MKLRPIWKNIVVKIKERQLEEKTKSWIIAYNREPSQNEIWIVEAVGKEVIDVKIGDKITFIRHGDQTGLKDLAICKEEEVIWILN